MAENSPKGYKTLWEKEKLLVTSNFSFSPSVFKRLLLQTLKNQGLFGTGFCHLFRLSFTKVSQRFIMTPRREKFENIVEKGENGGKQHFLLFSHNFYPSNYTSVNL